MSFHSSSCTVQHRRQHSHIRAGFAKLSSFVGSDRIGKSSTTLVFQRAEERPFRCVPAKLSGSEYIREDSQTKASLSKLLTSVLMAMSEAKEGRKVVQLHIRSAFQRILVVFAAWKLILLLTASASPGPGYDTSTQLLLPPVSHTDFAASQLLEHVLTRLVRWDGLYFVSIANDGYRYEQEWAFGWGFTTLLNYVARGIESATSKTPSRLSTI